MIRIGHNIGRVKDRFKTIERRIREAGVKSMTPSMYRDGLVRLAYQTLDSLMTPEEDTAMHILLSSIISRGIGSMMQFEMGGISIDRLGAPNDPRNVGGLENISRQEVEDWVREYKLLDPEIDASADGTYNIEKIASNVINAIKADPEPWFRTDRDGHGALNPTGLVQVTKLVQLPADRVSNLLLTVLDAWMDYLRVTVPQNLREEIRYGLGT